MTQSVIWSYQFFLPNRSESVFTSSPTSLPLPRSKAPRALTVTSVITFSWSPCVLHSGPFWLVLHTFLRKILSKCDSALHKSVSSPTFATSSLLGSALTLLIFHPPKTIALAVPSSCLVNPTQPSALSSESTSLSKAVSLLYTHGTMDLLFHFYFYKVMHVHGLESNGSTRSVTKK